MKQFCARVFTALILTLGVAAAVPSQSSASVTQRVVLAGGCCWGLQGVFEPLKGVTQVVAGYSGGSAATAHYEIVSTGLTGHAESVEITYNPSQISFKQLLDVYFLVAHDPTELNRQGPDDGSQYRSEIFYTSASQLAEAKAYIRHLSSTKVYSAPIVTKLEPLRTFYPAEAYHQDYMAHNPNDPYIVYNDKPKLAALHRRFPQLLK
ncbi:MAG TPA: peptide-methionine (S)-S-oxide reductase MsrA [Candidatus Rubrimentiphilum sp.]|nr:peptide-methionine (S)-S-oxide reductase MsrA [Candidatus Rubrimentiphilum sp.]